MLILIVSCKKESERITDTPHKDTLETGYSIMADTISYGIVVKNRDTTDEWQQKWLENLKRDSLVDRIFEAVYNKELKAYDYFTEEELSIKDIKELEKREEFSRSKIGKMQFEETWHFDTTNLKMVKSVNAIMLAYEAYRDDSTFKGYKPVFKVYLNSPFHNKNDR